MRILALFNKVIDCGSPMGGVGVVIEPYNGTRLDAVSIFHCQQSDDLMMAVCSINGKWIPAPTDLNCVVASGNHLSSIVLCTTLMCHSIIITMLLHC